jgi:Rrf2 family transcriptional regulator, nitric oxide-sensitive transcriptional repressor
MLLAMRLTRFTDNTMRVLTYLARAGDATPTVADVAEATDLTEDIVLKVTRRVSELGYVATIRGRAGGIRLVRRPDEINLGALVRATEENMTLVSCFDPNAKLCPLAPTCTLGGVLDRALAAFLEVLDAHTLAHLLSCQSENENEAEIDWRTEA